MEYHWYEDYWAMPRNLPRGHEFFIGYYQTQRAIHHHVAFIHTDQSCFLSTHLFDQGYRIFLHFKSGTVTEVGRGENPALPVRIIRENMNLEAPLLAGLLGKLTVGASIAPICWRLIPTRSASCSWVKPACLR